ncbi:actin-related protein 2/3 complex subunit 1B-like [Argentina anserina]|uniref:actin-related protein 2/3 complex subunit 1B-like n=1 Tax=Argentina anserina TaxID=57926 RepID=UPI00217623BA|nr:actin-related protein 2/3 complex subunit 1B-like [Potentilla anserina]
MVMLNVALLCTSASPTLRPKMSQVVSMLEGRTEVQELISSAVISSTRPSESTSGENPSLTQSMSINSSFRTYVTKNAYIYIGYFCDHWWVSKLIRKRHDSSVTSVAWHPNNILLTTASTDGKCRIFSTYIKVVDEKESKAGSSSDAKFGELILQLDILCCWAFGVRWSPSGNTLAYVGHNSLIYFVDEVGPSPLAQNVVFHDLPLRDVLFLSERLVNGVGFDCNPIVFAADERGIWSFIRFIGERKITSSGPKYGSQLSGAFRTLYGQPKHGLGNDTNDHSRPQGTVHENLLFLLSDIPCLVSQLPLECYPRPTLPVLDNCIVPLGTSGSSKVMCFSTSGQ